MLSQLTFRSDHNLVKKVCNQKVICEKVLKSTKESEIECICPIFKILIHQKQRGRTPFNRAATKSAKVSRAGSRV